MVIAFTKLFIVFFFILLLTKTGAKGPPISGDYVAPIETPTVTVETKFGPVEGFRVEELEYSANIFVGIPYAAKPNKELRFEKPEAVEPWKGTLDAKKWPISCAPQCKSLVKFIGNVSEDCLYLNIFVPSNSLPKGKLYPVAVWIHGGAFSFGDTKYYGYKGFSKNYVSKGIIVVTIQYRLGPFGWFSTGNQVVPGNLGLWDQRQALLFLRDVLKDFGGDKDRITVLGHSAGATSTSLLAASPHTRDLFAQAYQISGSALLEWGNSPTVVKVSKDLVKLLDCPATTSSITLKNCLKSKSMEEILEASDKMGISRKAINTLYYQPYMETDWVIDDYFKELAKALPKPTLIGLTSSESYLTTIAINDSFATLFNVQHGVPKENHKTFTKQDFVDRVHGTFARSIDFGQFASDAANDLIKFYAESATDEDLKDPVYYFSQYTQLFSDIHFTVNVANEALEKAKLGWPTYVYLFDWTNSEIAEKFGFLNGAPHGMDLAYIMDAFIFADFEFNEMDHKIKKIMVDGIVNFIKTGNPSSKEEPWPVVSKSMEVNFPYKFLGLRNYKAATYFSSKLKFWRAFNDKYHFDVIRGVYKQTNNIKTEL